MSTPPEIVPGHPSDAAPDGIGATLRESIDLSGPWIARPDPADEGERGSWWEFFSWWDNHAACTVPGVMQHALGDDFKGVAWMGKVCAIPHAWRTMPGARLWFVCQSASTDARVWVNGVEVGRHTGDFVPFQFEITEPVRRERSACPFPPPEGQACIAVRVDQMHAPRPAPGVLTENGHITKGFHDVLSLQHAGLWGATYLRATGQLAAIPNGVCALADPRTGEVRIEAELEAHGAQGSMHVTIFDDAGKEVAHGREDIGPGARTTVLTLRVDSPRPWSPVTPTRYHAAIQLIDEHGLVDAHSQRFGFRTVETGGPKNSHLLLNGAPTLLRGILHWGHEPAHIAPAPTPEQVRAEFTRLRELGFNTVCLCMVYLPEHFYDIADETGMLLWQEHPMWKSPMGDEHLAEYKRILDDCFRRDRRHPSVVLVSGSCEHEAIHRDLAAWWWKRSAERLPRTARQIQTAFIAWTNPDQTDMHDEHVYESSGRWVRFLEDLQTTLATLPPKPFAMGETIICADWPDTAALHARFGTSRPWWLHKGLDACTAFEERIAARFGADVPARFRRQAAHHNLEHRKFQSEAFRCYSNHAAWVMNHIRDVPVSCLGFMDDLDRWRFTPSQLRPWLGDAAILLRTPEHGRGFESAARVNGEIGISNFAPHALGGTVIVEAAHAHGAAPSDHATTTFTEVARARLHADRGAVAFAPVPLAMPAAKAHPVPLRLRARLDGVDDVPAPNSWTLWAFPSHTDAPPDTVRLDGLPFSARDHEMTFEERSYSSGWGLKNLTWKPALPDLTRWLFKAPLWRFDAPLPHGTRVIATHALTRRVIEFLDGGGRVLLLASRLPGGLGANFFCTWAQSPLVIERGPLARGDSDWIVDLLHIDLTRRTTRVVPTEDLGIHDAVDPVVRMAFGHDRGAPKVSDAVFHARVGKGVLAVSALDHTDAAGRHLLHQLLAWLGSDAPTSAGALEVYRVRAWSLDI